jgi:hypothetical protein
MGDVVFVFRVYLNFDVLTTLRSFSFSFDMTKTGRDEQGYRYAIIESVQ